MEHYMHTCKTDCNNWDNYMVLGLEFFHSSKWDSENSCVPNQLIFVVASFRHFWKNILTNGYCLKKNPQFLGTFFSLKVENFMLKSPQLPTIRKGA